MLMIFYLHIVKARLHIYVKGIGLYHGNLNIIGLIMNEPVW